jgi:Skp family chaperone for outer membrane proteins
MRNLRSSAWRRTLAVVALCAAGVVIGTSWRAAVAVPASEIAARATPSAVAVVNLNRLVDGLAELAELQERLKQRADASRRRLEELGNQLKAVEQDLEEIRDVEARVSKFAEKVELEAQLKTRREVLQRILDLEQGRVMRQTFLKIMDACKRLAETDGWDLILVDDRDGLPDMATGEQITQLVMLRQVLYANERVDVTDQLITLMNNEFKAGVR